MAKFDVHFWLDHVPEHSDDKASLMLMREYTSRTIDLDEQMRRSIEAKYGPGSPIAAEFEKVVAPQTKRLEQASRRIEERLQKFE